MVIMRLIGVIDPARPLLVVAVEQEAAHLDSGLPVLLTGMGKVNAAMAVASALAGPVRPAAVVNLGTAGALRPGWSGTHEIRSVLQHDLNSAVLHALTGETVGAPVELIAASASAAFAAASASAGPVLATGDLFVSDETARQRLAERADLVDMEGYAVASAARAAGVPVRLVKHISDEAGEGAGRTWRESVDACAVQLAAWAREHLG
jgi:adenosylhomocysteine nucleosidase